MLKKVKFAIFVIRECMLQLFPVLVMETDSSFSFAEKLYEFLGLQLESDLNLERSEHFNLDVTSIPLSWKLVGDFCHLLHYVSPLKHTLPFRDAIR